jgi:hypothetical protein
MELRKFISDSLLQIVQGVVDSSSDIASLGGAVSPAYSGAGDGHVGSTLANGKPVHAIEFDVVVSVSAGASTEGHEVISVASAHAKSSSAQSEQTAETSRLRFVIPLQLPTDLASQKEADDARRRNSAAMGRRMYKPIV